MFLFWGGDPYGSSANSLGLIQMFSLGTIRIGLICFYASILTPIGSPLGSLMVDGVIVLADVLPFSMLSQAVV